LAARRAGAVSDENRLLGRAGSCSTALAESAEPMKGVSMTVNEFSVSRPWTVRLRRAA
jgi:hypothetical protein